MSSSEAKALDSLLGAFLRARRQQVRPQQQDLVPGGPRQVVGLRRDEVAMLAGISAGYYVRLEQGRERHPSPAVLDGLSTALLLDRASSRYLRELAAADSGTDDKAEGSDVLEPGRLDAVRPLLDSLTVPAILVDRWLNIAAANALGEMLHEGLEHRENYARMVFLSPGVQDFFVDWSELAHCMVAALRASTGSTANAGRLERLVGELVVASEVFSTAWAQHDVYEKAIDRKRFRHPMVGPLVFNRHVLELPDSDGHQVWAYHPTDDATREALVRLASLATLSDPAFTRRDESTA